MFHKLSALLLIVAALAMFGCGSGGTVEKTVLRTKVATLDSVYLADAAARLAAKSFDTNCPKNVFYTVDQCRGWRHFANGRAPADPICAAPTFDNLADVYKQCGFHKAFPTVLRAYQENKEMVSSIAAAVDLLIGGAKDQTAIAVGR